MCVLILSLSLTSGVCQEPILFTDMLRLSVVAPPLLVVHINFLTNCLPAPYNFLTNCLPYAELITRCEGSHFGSAGVCMEFPYQLLTSSLPIGCNSKDSFCSDAIVKIPSVRMQ